MHIYLSLYPSLELWERKSDVRAKSGFVLVAFVVRFFGGFVCSESAVDLFFSALSFAMRMDERIGAWRGLINWVFFCITRALRWMREREMRRRFLLSLSLCVCVVSLPRARLFLLLRSADIFLSFFLSFFLLQHRDWDKKKLTTTTNI